MRQLVVLLFIFVSSKTFATSSNEGLWETLTTSDGLSQGMVYDLIQDEKGFFWIGTKDGLNRYDGYSFDSYLYDRANPYSISGNTVTSLFLDSKKRIWAGTDVNGLNLFDVKRRRFYKIMLTSARNEAVYIKKIKEAPDGRIWVGTYTGEVFLIELPDYMNKKEGFPFSIDFTKEVRVTKLFDLEKYSCPILDFFFDSNGSVKIACGIGLFDSNWKKPSSTKALLIAKNMNEKAGLALNWEYFAWSYQQFVRDKSGRFWGVRKDKLVVVDAKGQVGNIDISSVPSDIRYTFLSKDGRIHLFFEGDFYSFDPEELLRAKKIHTFKSTPIPFDANTTWPSSMYEDANGTFWIGTVGFGIRKVAISKRGFQTINDKNPAYSLFEDKNGNVYLNNRLNFFVALRTNGYENPKPLQTKYNLHLGLLQDASDTSFWLIGSQVTDAESRKKYPEKTFYLANYTRDWKLLKQYRIPIERFIKESGGSFLQVKDGSLWMASTNGYLLRFIPKQEKFEKYSFDKILTKKGINKDVYSLYESADRTLWVGTRSGLIRVKRNGKALKIKLFDSKPSDLSSLPSNFISSTLDDPLQPDKYLWISTRGGGIVRMDKQKETFEVIDKKNGLLNLVVYGMVTDNQKNIWASTNYGISKINPRTLRAKSYTKRDGLQDDEFNTYSYAKSPTGELLFGGVNGVNRFNPLQVEKKTQKPSVQIVRMWVNNEVIQTELESTDTDVPMSIEYLNELKLMNNQNQISFDLAVMDYSNPAKNQFKYRMEGITDDWVKLEGRSLNFSNLAPETYRLEIIGSTDGENWSAPRIFTFTIYPPFYLSNFAYFVYFILFIGALTWLYRVQTQRLLLQQRLLFEQKESERLSELNDLKTSFFTSISHEFRTPLTLIIGAVERLNDQSSQHTKVIRRHAKRLLNLTNQLLDLSKLEASKADLDLKPMEVSAFVGQLAQLFQPLAENKQIHFEVTKPSIPQWLLLDADKLEKIIVNLLSNAFKFTKPDGQVNLTIGVTQTMGKECLSIRIDDTGIGIKEEDLPHIFNRFFRIVQNEGKVVEGTGIGLTLVKELVTLLNGTISVKSEYKVGTSFVIKLPVQYVYPQQVEINTQVNSSPTDVEDLYKEVSGDAVEEEYLEKVADEKQKNTLLIVDDNPDIRWLIRDVFEQEYTIICAENGVEGIEKAFEYIPDLILTDLMMPTMNGMQMVDVLLQDERTSHIPVVMLTAKVDEKVQIESLQKGVIDYLVKPFAVNHLKLKVTNLLLQRDKARDFFKKKPLTTVAKSPKLSRIDKAFIERLNSVLEGNYMDAQFNVDKFSEEMNMSNSQLLRKLRALLGVTVVEYLRDFRLSKAESLFRNLEVESVSDAAYNVGFQNLSYFSKVFQEKYSVSPSEFMEICQTDE
ncbi:MAG: ATP-binding protein [Spirosomataceae bacterium]